MSEHTEQPADDRRFARPSSEPEATNEAVEADMDVASTATEASIEPQQAEGSAATEPAPEADGTNGVSAPNYGAFASYPVEPQRQSGDASAAPAAPGFDQQAAYGQRAAYGQPASGEQAPPAQQQPYGYQQPYGQQTPYGQSGPYGQPAPGTYAQGQGQGEYGVQNPYSQFSGQQTGAEQPPGYYPGYAQQPGYAVPAYGAAPYGQPVPGQKRFSTLTIVALILAGVAMLANIAYGLGGGIAIAAIICGFIAVRRNPQAKPWPLIAALTGIVALVVSIAMWVIQIVNFAVAFSELSF